VGRCDWLAEIGQERRNNQKHDDEWSIHDHAAAIFNMSPRAQFLRFGDATSAVLSQQLNLGSQRKISAIGGNLWNNEIPSIVPNHRYFPRRSETWVLRKHRRSSVAESQKLSSGANVKDYHTQNDRTGPFQPEIILIEYLVHM
jgi:hypothetical protein